MSNRTRPPAFQKYRDWARLGNVISWTKSKLQAFGPVAVVLEILPVQVELVVPELVANPRLIPTLVISVATLDKIATTPPVTGAVLEVNVVPVWLPAVARVLTKLAQLVAVTTPFELTALNAVCPQP
jgi:hypothetical protein